MIKPKSKLTLWVPEDVKEFGKRFSKRHNKSLSELFTGFLQRLQDSQDNPSQVPEIIQNMKGVVKSSKGTRKDYQKHIEKKYL